MKSTLVFLILFTLCCVGFASERPAVEADLGSLLEEEPAAASQSFVETKETRDSISFSDSGSASASDPVAAEESEFDGQIAQVEEDMKKVKEQIKESQECAHRLMEQNAEYRTLTENRDRLLKEKEKVILQSKLEKQMHDLAEINRMSRTLRTKFAELKRTQQMIKSRLTGTKASLNQLEASPDLTMDDIKKEDASIVKDVDEMHSTQKKLLTRAQTSDTDAVKKELENELKINLQGRAGSSSSASSKSA
jgi:chromosome segregation ATPase